MNWSSLFALGALGAAAQPAPAFSWATVPPAFSWATVPLYQHLASVNATPSVPFPPARLAWLAKTFPVVVLEHAHGMGAWAYTPPSGAGSTWGPAPFLPPGGYIEDAFSAAAAALKALNSSITILYYQQITGALPYYRASQPLNSNMHWALDANCNPVGAGASRAISRAISLDDILPNYVTYAYDHLQPGVTENFVAAFVNMTSTAAFDGTFIDTASCYSAPGQADASLATVQAMQTARPDKIVGFHTDSSLKGANGFSAAMDYTFAVPAKKRAAGPVKKPSKDTSGQAGLDWLNANAAAGVISFAHIGDVDQGADMKYSLAVFLAGAYNRSFFAFSSADKMEPSWEECWDGDAPTWPISPSWCSGQGGSADFARPLGAPLGPATSTGGAAAEVTRTFASGTTLTVQLLGKTCTIAWADGHTTTCG
jgi:hypothetical protein